MADTLNIVLTKDVYTEISGGALEGFLSNVHSNDIYYVESALLPDPNLKGHTVKQESDGVTFKLSAGQKVWARAIQDGVKSLVAVTVQ